MVKIYTYGVFDLIHPGHTRILQRAKNLGDYLIVGIVGDKAVEELKGKGRPVQSLKDRMEIIANFIMVDEVVIQETYDPTENIRYHAPAVLAKGDDWEYIPGAEAIATAGGELVKLPYSKEFSTTDIVRRIKEC